jgi:DNA gyrase subunit A
MLPKRPDLSGVTSEVRKYIEALEHELKAFHFHRTEVQGKIRVAPDALSGEPIDEILLGEPPTTMSVITATKAGIAKRTYRHKYNLQRRGGMGVFDLETSDNNPPTLLTLADEKQHLLLITNQARVFRMPVNQIEEAPVRARGDSIVVKLGFHKSEHLAAVIPDKAEGYLALAGKSGKVRLLRHHIFGEYMKPGTGLYDYKLFGELAAASWTPGDGDLLIATSQGRAIRFSQKLVPPQGVQAIRLSKDDSIVGITPVTDESAVFLLGADGKGTVRLMSGFAANKAPGAGGKIAMNTSRLIGVQNVDDREDIFLITKLCKIIRFRVAEVPPKEGVVQGVVCITLRGDEPTAVAVNPNPVVS